jgi:phytol kinase
MTHLDGIKVLALVATAAVLFAALRAYQVRRSPDPESVRKLLHVSAGLMGLSLPWLFDRLTPVLVLGALVGGGLVALRVVRSLNRGVGQVLHGVGRHSVGEFGFVISCGLLFWLSGHDKLLYSVPLLMLGLGDAMAALLGTQYGRLLLQMRGPPKSYEGIAAFFLTSFFCVHVPVLLWGGTGRLESLLIAVDVSALVMMAEAAAWWGLDNLIIPLWGYMVLKSLIQMDAVQLATHLAFLLSLALFMRFWRDRTTLGDDALFGATLWGYVVWAVGGWLWVLPPLIQMAIYATLTFRAPWDQLRSFRFPTVLANIAGSVFWLLAFRETDIPDLFLPFAACFAANVAIIGLVREKVALPNLTARVAISRNVALGMIVVLPSALAFGGLRPLAALDLGAGLLAVYIATALFYRLQPALSAFPVGPARWLRQAIIVSACSTIALGIRYGVLFEIDLVDVFW